MASTVRVEDKVHAALLEIAKAERRPIGQVIEAAIAQYQKEKFWQDVHDDYERLRAKPDAWKNYQEELLLLEGGSLDGLVNEEPYYSPKEEEQIRAESARTPIR